MKITLIRPNIGSKNGKKYKDIAPMEPYALAVLAGVTPPDVELKLLDDRLENIDYNENTDMVAINVETFTAMRAYQVAKKYRSIGVPVVLGGFHASLMPEEAAQHADSVVVGEVEPVWKEVIRDFQTGSLKKLYKSGFQCNLDGHFPDRSIYAGKKYIPLTLTHYSRGCPYRCTYCPDAILYDGGIRYRNVDDVVRDIESQKRKLVMFVDNNISSNKKKFKELLEAIIPLKIKWLSQADIDVGEDKELLQLMYKSGCTGLVMGFETLDMENLTRMNKPQNIKRLNRYDELIKRIHDHGVALWGAFLIGYDSDTLDTFKYTLDFALKHKFFFAAFNPLIPYHGTSIYDQLKQENRLIHEKWWIAPEFRFGEAAFKPKNMTPEQLTDGCIDTLFKFNSNLNILKRATNISGNLNTLTKLRLYTVYPVVFRRELRNKKFIRLGYDELL